MFKTDNNKVIQCSTSKPNKTIINLFKSKKSKNYKSGNLTYVLNVKATKKPILLTSGTKKTFNELR